MNIREKTLQSLYDLAINEVLCTEMEKSFIELDGFITSVLPGGERDENKDPCTSLICSLEHAAFFAGANMVLDFISGKGE